ncbi:MAG TPA: hypothetical protein P5160_03460 [Candidatus Omnitrophota bacterium]|jgi:predicted transcriptional regulator of viral defense system|nr:hypothetical protein [Candidatus Omnitrophota bacterium]
MKYEEFVKYVRDLPVIESELFIATEPNPDALKVQFSRWVATGKLIQLRRGVYVLPAHYCDKPGNAFYAANILKKPSYISLEKALEFYGLIPEAVRVFTSVTSKRAGHFENDLGEFDYRHIHPDLFWGYQPVKLEGQNVLMARPEKAVLDLMYLNAVDVSSEFFDGLRLQNIESLNAAQLADDARRFGKSVMVKRANVLAEYLKGLQQGERRL